MAKGILIIGTGAQAKYALEIFNLNNMTVCGLVALSEESPPESLDNTEILGDLQDFESIYQKCKKPSLLLCCSRNKDKEELKNSLSKYEPEYTNAIHPKAVIARTAVLGRGIIVNACAVIQPYARIGNHVMVHAGVIVEHDCILENFVNLAPKVALAGHVKIGKGTIVYAGAVICPTVKTGDYCTVGAGSVVLRRVEDGKKVAGVPASEIKPEKDTIK